MSPSWSRSKNIVNELPLLDLEIEITWLNTSRSPLVSFGTRLVESDSKVTSAPLAEIDGLILSLFPSTFFGPTYSHVVFSSARSRTNTCTFPVTQRLPARLLAADEKATNRPSKEIEGWRLSLLPWFPRLSMDAQVVRSSTVSRTKTWLNPLLQRAVKLVGSALKTTNRPSPDTLASALLPLLCFPSLFTEMQLVSPVTRLCM